MPVRPTRRSPRGVLRSAARGGLAAAVLVCLATAALAAETLSFDAQPFQHEGTTMVPMRGIFEWLGAEVTYYKGEIIAVAGEGADQREIRLRNGQQMATIGGQEIALAVAPLTRSNRAYVPLRFVAEALGASVAYDSAARKITITKGARQGELLVPSGKPEPYNYNRLMSFAMREEKLGDSAKKAGNADGSRMHYSAALGALRRIHTEEAARSPLVQAMDALLQRDYDAVERLSLKAAGGRPGGRYTAANIRARDRVTKANEIRYRIEDKVPPPSPSASTPAKEAVAAEAPKEVEPSAPTPEPPPVQAAMPGPLVLSVPVGGPLALGGTFHLSGGPQLGPYLLLLRSDDEDKVTLSIDNDFRFVRGDETFAGCAVTGTGRIQVLPSEQSWLMVPVPDAKGEFPSVADYAVEVPFKQVPSMTLAALREHLAGPDWLERASAAWVIGERGYKEAAPLLLAAIKQEERFYAACYEAAAIARLDDAAVTSQLEQWLAALGETAAETRLRDEVRRVLQSPTKGVPPPLPN